MDLDFLRTLFSADGGNDGRGGEGWEGGDNGGFNRFVEAGGDLFGNVGGNFMAAANEFQRAAFDPQGGGNGPRGPPPASSKALRQLPTVVVSPEDLIDESNRECCICLEENHLKDRVVRLPCAHIFHQDCITDWLKHHCTCPVCRYELETDDADYERSRRQRMASRKPRIHTYELERMSVKELRDMIDQLRVRVTPTACEKRDLIQALVQSGRIQVVAAPKPAQHKLRDLERMGAGQLKRTMAEAGVFFDPIDVVEKKDMVRIFCNSGRLVLLPDPEYERQLAQQHEAQRLARELQQQQEEERQQQQQTMQDSKPAAIDEFDVDAGSATCDDDSRATASSLSKRPVVETVSEGDDAPRRKLSTAMRMFGSASELPESSSREENEHDFAAASNRGDDDDHQESMQEADMAEAVQDESVPAQIDARARFQNLSVAALRQTARGLCVDLSDCIERSEMVDKLAMATEITAQKFEGWSVSTVRALASSVEVDLSDCIERSAMVDRLVGAARERPHVAAYLGALMPLAGLSISELRGTARQWQVNVRDCLEKEEIVHRLAAAFGGA